MEVCICSCVIELCRYIILHLINSFFDQICCWCDECIDLSMCALTNFEEDDGAFANDLVDYQSRNNYKEDGAESKAKVELASVDIIV